MYGPSRPVPRNLAFAGLGAAWFGASCQLLLDDREPTGRLTAPIDAADASSGDAGLGAARSGDAGLGDAGTWTPRPFVRAKQLALGDQHSCALFENGRVLCWGNGEHGALGTGATSTIGDDETPAHLADVDVGGDVVQLAASRAFTCALLQTGAVRCWGAAAAGQLGYGNTNDIGDDEAPASAGDVQLVSPVRQITAGPTSVCALLEAQELSCWGTGFNGAPNSPGASTGAQNVEPIGDDETPASAGLFTNEAWGDWPRQAQLGGGRLCLLLDQGRVRCSGIGQGAAEFGSYHSPLLVDGGLADNSEEDAFVVTGGVLDSLASGLTHNCVLLDTGAVRCWGFGVTGQLGYGSTEDIGDDETPLSAGNVPVGGRVTQLALGAAHSCALLATGAVRCWGSGGQGRLGYGDDRDIGDDERPSDAGDVAIGEPATYIAAGATHTCAVLASGAVRCWGSGESGALGYGNTQNIGDDETPSAAGDVPLF